MQGGRLKVTWTQRMARGGRTWLAASALVLCRAVQADAQVAAPGAASEQSSPSEAAGGYGARARVVRPLAARNEEDPTAAATTVELTKRPMALETLREVIPEIPGAIALSAGGYGAFSSVSLRGSDLAQTVWLLGDVPLNGPDSGAFDMSLLPLAQLQKLEVYRSGAPVWYGQGSIGGVIRVVPREAPGTGVSVQAGAGSWGLYEARASSYVSRLGRRPISLYSGVQVTSAQNDYRYLDDNGTNLGANRKADDVERRLHNAQLQDGVGLLHLRAGALGGHVDVIFYALGRTGGAPGTAGLSSNARLAHRDLKRGLLSLAYTREGKNQRGRRYRLQLLASGQGEQRGLYDPAAELALGGPRDLTQNLGRVTGRLAGSLELTRFLEATVVATYTGDHFRDHDALKPILTGPSHRDAEAVSGELRLFGRVFGLRGELRASARGEVSQTALSVLQVQTLAEVHHTIFSPVYRIAAALEPHAGLSLRGSVGTGKRVPSIHELFGDGGNFVPNPNLVPEQGRYADGGLVLSQAFGPTCLVIEANGFWSDVSDKIVILSSDGYHSVAENLGYAKAVGAELGSDFSYRDSLRVVGAATFMNTQATYGLQVPRQPKARAYGRVEGTLHFGGALDRATLFATTDYVSTAYFDPGNTALRHPYTHVGFGAAFGFLEERLELQARVSDVFDARGQDYQRLPLPGRSFGLLLSVKEKSP
jgi:iron complex outermembrane receptor protein